uniref:Uncharacterized protein n=1 Tax=Romanomermis culicivorax TaxID=13658 RepID=A0A915JSE1_ROMCU
MEADDKMQDQAILAHLYDQWPSLKTVTIQEFLAAIRLPLSDERLAEIQQAIIQFYNAKNYCFETMRQNKYQRISNAITDDDQVSMPVVGSNQVYLPCGTDILVKAKLRDKTLTTTSKGSSESTSWTNGLREPLDSDGGIPRNQSWWTLGRQTAQAGGSEKVKTKQQAPGLVVKSQQPVVATGAAIKRPKDAKAHDLQPRSKALQAKIREQKLLVQQLFPGQWALQEKLKEQSYAEDMSDSALVATKLMKREAIGANDSKTKAKIKAKIEAKSEANASGDNIQEGLEDAMEVAGRSIYFQKIEMRERGLHDQLDHRPTTCHNMQTVQPNLKSTQFGTDGKVILL